MSTYTIKVHDGTRGLETIIMEDPLKAIEPVYKAKIHKAVADGGEFDPYTGEPLAWELISKWDTSHSLPKGRLEYFSFYLYQHPEGYKNP